MPAPNILPPADDLVRMHSSGMTYEQIGAEYGVTKQAVMIKIRNTYPEYGARRPRYGNVLPWRVKPQHEYLQIPLLLRIVARALEGDQLSPEDEFKRERFLWMLKEHGLVVDYDPEAPPNPASPVHGGWRYLKRVASDGDVPIRMPRRKALSTGRGGRGRLAEAK